MDEGIKKLLNFVWTWVLIVIGFGLIVFFVWAYQTNFAEMRGAVDHFWQRIAG